MTFENTLQAMFDHYPTLFKDRADCLNQLFCTLGNGYAWIDGQLVSMSLPEPIHSLKDGKAFQYNLLSLREEARQLLERRKDWSVTKKSPEEIKAFVRTLPDNIYHRRPRAQRWYFRNPANDTGHNFYEDYVPLFQYPDNVQPDWIAGMNECRAMLTEDGYMLPKVRR